MGTLGDLTNLEAQLAEAQSRLDQVKHAMELKAAADIEHRKNTISSMPAMIGCATVEELITQLQLHIGIGLRKVKTRTVMTPEKRAQIEKMLKEGKTGAEITKTLGISIGTLQNYKKAAGLVRTRAVTAAA